MDDIDRIFKHQSSVPSDINEHLPTLSKYASECESVFETGVRGCISTWALAHGLLHNGKASDSRRLLMNDINACNIQDILYSTGNLPIQVDYIWKNNLELTLTQRYDLTFIDTWHVYGQLKRELAKFAPITNKYIVMHDTTVDEWLGETIRANWDATAQSRSSGIPVEEINKGLWPAIDEFLLDNNDWVLHERYTNNNGLTVLRRKNT
jgi:hypothetical protein